MMLMQRTSADVSRSWAWLSVAGSSDLATTLDSRHHRTRDQ
jgi:hypothetical protein